MLKSTILFIFFFLVNNNVFSQTWENLGDHGFPIQMISNNTGFKKYSQVWSSGGSGASGSTGILMTTDDWNSNTNFGSVSYDISGCCWIQKFHFFNSYVGTRASGHSSAARLQLRSYGGSSWTDMGGVNGPFFEKGKIQTVNDSITIAVGWAPNLGDSSSDPKLYRASVYSLELLFSFDIYSRIENGFHFIDENHGYLIVKDSNSHSICFRTIDGGSSWQLMLYDSVNTFTSIFVLDENHVFIGSSNGVLINSTDGGQNWNQIQTPITDTLNHIQFISPDNGYMAFAGGELIKTIDAGLNWNTENLGISGRIVKLFYVDEETAYCVVNQNGQYGPYYLLKYQISNTSTFCDEHLKVYPNPNKGEFNIDFDSFEDNISVEIKGVNGSLVYRSLFNEQKNLLIETDFNGGIYFLKIQTDNMVCTSKIMVDY